MALSRSVALSLVASICAANALVIPAVPCIGLDAAHMRSSRCGAVMKVKEDKAKAEAAAAAQAQARAEQEAALADISAALAPPPPPPPTMKSEKRALKKAEKKITVSSPSPSAKTKRPSIAPSKVEFPAISLPKLPSVTPPAPSASEGDISKVFLSPAAAGLGVGVALGLLPAGALVALRVWLVSGRN